MKKQLLQSIKNVVHPGRIVRRIKKIIWQKQFVIVLVMLGISGLVSPRVPGVLKLLSFIEKDFITSTSEYMFESTETHPELQVRIGRSDDPQGFHLAIFKDGAHIAFTGVSYQPGTQIVVPPPSTSPTISPSSSATPLPTTDIISQSASDAAQQVASESASHSTQSAELISTASTSALPKAIESIDQSFFGTYEKLILQPAVYPQITYHWEGSRLVETWSITAQNAEFTFNIEQSGLTIAGENGSFLLFKDAVPVVELTTTVHDAKGAETPVIQSITGMVLTLTIDPAWVTSPDRVYPLTLVRNYQTLTNNQLDPKVVLATNIAPEIVATALEIPAHSQFFTSYADQIIFFDEQTHVIYSLINGALAPVATLPEKIIALSCSSHGCTAVTHDGMYLFDVPTEQKSEPATLMIESKVASPVTPLGGYAQTEATTFLTQNTNPGGTVRALPFGATQSTIILDNLSYAQAITATHDGSLVGVWANGQLYIAAKSEGFSFTILPAPPIAVTAGLDGYIYSIVTLDDGIQGIVRTASGKNEVLKDLRGAFTGILWKEGAVYIAHTFNQRTGYLLHVPLEGTEWEPL